MKRLTPLLISMGLCGGLLAAGQPDIAKPNVVLILADDLGWKDVGYQGSDYYETPNIDQLSKEGMVFTAGYAGGGNCMPSRACLISGNYTPRHGVYAVGTTDRGIKEAQRLKPIPNQRGLSLENFTIAKGMRAVGYTTGIFGKWHVGFTPDKQGFDVVYQSASGWKEQDEENPKGVFSLTQAAGDFIEKNKSKPFFVYLPHYAIHVALQAKNSTLNYFKAKPPGRQHNDPLYAACLKDLDTGIGLLLQRIKDLGLENNTLVVFTSDNGGTTESSQEPLRGNKGAYYEGGIREPFIVRWPGVTKPGSSCDVPVINVDFFPTFLAAAGAPVPADKILDGENLLPLLHGGTTLNRPAIFWHFPGYLDKPVTRGRDIDVRAGFRSRPVSVIHKGEWKLHLYHEEWQLDGGRARIPENHAVELYHLTEDIGEQKDLAMPPWLPSPTCNLTLKPPLREIKTAGPRMTTINSPF